MPFWCKSCWLISFNYLIKHLVSNFAFSAQGLSPGNFSVHYKFKSLPGCTFLCYSKYIFVLSHHLWCVTFCNRVLKSYFMAVKLLGEIHGLNNPIQHLLSCGTVPRTGQISECEVFQFGSTVRLKNFPLHGWMVRSTEFRTIQFILWQQQKRTQ